MGELRTIMAADRTLMAWIRTGLSMLSFGFTIYKFLEGVAETRVLPHPHSAQQAGLFLCALGTVSIAVGTFDYWSTLRDLRRTEAFRIDRPVLIIAAVTSVGGILLFASIAIRLI